MTHHTDPGERNTSPPSVLDGPAFTNTVFTDLALEAADLSGKEFEGCSFVRCKLPESRWSQTTLEECVFHECDLSRMAPRKLTLRGVVFRDTRLTGVDWTGLGPSPVVAFEGCDLRYASFVKTRLPGTRLVGCVARAANFLQADLTGADLSGTDLAGCTIEGCGLENTNFSRATGVLFDPTRNRTKGARISLDAAVAIMRTFGIAVEDFGPTED